MADVVPKSYDELVEVYWVFITQMLLRQGIPPDELEDYGQEYLLRFLSRDRLKAFDPNYRGLRTKFVTFLGADLKLFALQRRRDIAKRDRDRDRHETEDFRVTVQLLENQSVLDEIEYMEVVLGVRQDLSRRGLAIDRPRVKCTYVEAWDLCVESVEQHGLVNRRAIAERLGVSERTVGTVVRKIQRFVRAYLREVETA